MLVAWVQIRDFRNHREVSLELGPGLSAVVGPNGRGKTNLLEALFYLCWLTSPRVSSDLPLVRSGAESAFLRGEVEAGGGRFLIEVEVRSSGANRVQLNRSAVRRKRDLRRHVRAVFSGPEDLRVVLGDPEHRRRFMDEAGAILWPGKDGLAGAYERVLRQRNRLLKEWDGPGEPPDLAAWDAELVTHGTALTAMRREAMERISGRAAEEFHRIVGHEEALRVTYVPSVEGVSEGLEQQFSERLATRRGDELVRHRHRPRLDQHWLRLRRDRVTGFGRGQPSDRADVAGDGVLDRPQRRAERGMDLPDALVRVVVWVPTAGGTVSSPSGQAAG